MWERYFKLCNIKPGKVVIHKFGLINFADPNIPPEKVLKIYKSGCRFLELTPEGEEYLYGRKTTSNTKTTNVNSSWAGDKGEAAFKNPDKNKTVSQSPAFDEENKEEKTKSYPLSQAKHKSKSGRKRKTKPKPPGQA